MNLLLSFFHIFIVFFSSNLSELREQYVQSSESKLSADNFYNLALKSNNDKPIFMAYLGAATALKSRYVTKREDKKALFVEGVSLVEKAIKADANNPEIRMIRLSIQENTPKILKYKSNINEDKNSILATYAIQNKDLKDYLKSFIKQSKSFTEAEKNNIIK